MLNIIFDIKVAKTTCSPFFCKTAFDLGLSTNGRFLEKGKNARSSLYKVQMSCKFFNINKNLMQLNDTAIYVKRKGNIQFTPSGADDFKFFNAVKRHCKVC